MHWPLSVTGTDWFRLNVIILGCLALWQLFKIGAFLSAIRSELTSIYNALNGIQNAVDLLDMRIDHAIVDMSDCWSLKGKDDSEN